MPYFINPPPTRQLIAPPTVSNAPIIYALITLFLFFLIWLYKRLTKHTSPKNKLIVPSVTIDTSLHAMIKTSASLNDLNPFLFNTDKKNLSRMARTVDENGKLALDLIADKTAWAQTDRDKLKYLLIYLIVSHPFKRISTPMSMDKIVKRYHVSNKSELYQNLRIGCEVGNKVRSKFEASPSHAEANFYPLNYYSAINEKLNETREVDYFNQLKLSDFSLRNDITIHTCLRARRATEAGVGNCWEFTDEAVRILEEEYHIQADSLFLDPGDHIFAGFGKEDARVILDAHKGKIFPFNTFAKELKCFEQRSLDHQDALNCSAIQNPTLNIYTFFNPRYHKNPQLKNNIPDDFNAKLNHAHNQLTLK
jgi:hypothetical protein